MTNEEALRQLRDRATNYPGQTHGADEVSVWALAEIERLQAAMKGWSSYAWKDRCYVDEVQQYFDSVLKGVAPTSLDGIEVYDEKLGKSP